jgi:hypothetical protein
MRMWTGAVVCAALGVGCAAPEAPTANAPERSPSAAFGAGMLLEATVLVPAAPSIVDFSGGVPGGTVRVYVSLGGLGVGGCPPGAGGDCFDIASPNRLMGTATVGADGTAAVEVAIPAGAAGSTVWLQAIHSSAGDPAVISNVVEAEVNAGVPIAVAAAGDVVITEVMADPTRVPDANGEWFELYNRTSTTFDLDGLTVRDDGGDSFTVTGELLLRPRRETVLGPNDDFVTNGRVIVSFGYGAAMTLANGSDELILDNGVIELDRVAWDASYPLAPGTSLTLHPELANAAANDVALSWCTATSSYGRGDLGTPGRENDPCIDLVDDDEDGWSVGAGDCNDGDLTVYPGAPDLSADGIDQDCDGYDGVPPGVATLLAGDLVITELMPDPAAAADATGEWFEVLNAAGADVNLDGLEVADSAGTFTVSGATLLAAGARAVFATSGDPAVNGGLTVDVDYAGAISLSNDADSLTLSHSGGAVVLDSVTYDGGVTWPDGAGTSLSLDPASEDATTNDLGAAWCEGASAYGDGDLGTPGLPNDVCPPADWDGDGFSADVDCNDDDPDIFPGAPELPDGVDNDCDTIVDEVVLGAAELLPGDLVVTEVMQNPLNASDANGEWFEVLNASGELVDLDGVVLADAAGAAVAVSGSFELAPGERFVFGASVDPAVNGGAAIDYDFGAFALGNAADDIQLVADGTVIDAVAWDGGLLFPDPNGASMTLDPGAEDHLSNDDGARWCEASSPYGVGDLGTPGAPNDDCAPPPPTGLGVDDLLPGDLVITEILQDPAAVLDSSGEWFEVLNTTGLDVELEGLVVADDGGSSFTVSSSLLVAAGERVLFGANVDPLLNGGAPVAYDFGAFSLSNSDDELELRAGAIVVDRVAWTGVAPWPDPNGASMSLDPSATDAIANDDPLAWCEATTPFGDGDRGTPGEANEPCL